MIRNIVINLCYSFLLTNLYSCDSGDGHISTTEEIKNQIDSVKVKQAALSYNQGKQLFSRYCNTCHYIPEAHVRDQYLFDNLFERLPSPSEDYFVNYISDSKQLKVSGNEYAIAVDKEWESDYEHKFNDSLLAKDFVNLITYIKISVMQKYQNKGG